MMGAFAREMLDSRKYSFDGAYQRQNKTKNGWGRYTDDMLCTTLEQRHSCESSNVRESARVLAL